MIITDDSLLPNDGIQGPPGQSIVGPAGKDGTDGRPGADARSFNPRGTWANRNQYEVLDVVEFFGNSYVAREASKGKYPPSYPRVWQLLAAKGDDGKDGETKVYKVGSPRLVSAMAEIQELKQQIQGGSVSATAIFDSTTQAGMAVYISGDGHVDLAQADNVDTATAVGIAIGDVTADQPGMYVTCGPVVNPSWNLIPGTVYYLSPTSPGGLTSIYPTTPGHFVVILGAAATPTQLNLEIHWMLEQS